MSAIVMIEGRLSFPQLTKPKASALGGPLKYGGDFILAPDSPSYLNFMKVVNEIAIEKWKDKAPNVLAMINADKKIRCYGKGEEITNKTTFLPYEGYVGNVHISGNNDDPPTAIDPTGNPIDPANTMAAMAQFKRMYGGCHVSAALNPWCQDNDHGVGLRCKLIAIQFLRDDVPFGEAPPDLTGKFGAAPTGGGTSGGPAPGGMPSFLG